MGSAGIFATFAPLYADCGIATFPVDATKKKPLVERPHLFGIRASRQLATDPKFADAGVGTWCGPRSGITALDVDEPGDAPLRRVVELCGDTPVRVQTPSGGHHLYFRYNGERRLIRPNGMRLDVLGSGLAVLPQSEGENGTYRFLSGGFDELKHRNSLPTINREVLNSLRERRETAPRDEARWQAYEQAAPPTGCDVGIRNKTLFDFCRSVAATVDTLAELQTAAHFRNEQFDPPLPDAEVQRTVQSVWRYRLGDRLFLSGCEPTIPLTRSEFEALRPDKLALAMYLNFRFSHGAEPGKIFAAATARFASENGVRPSRVTSALMRLVDGGFLLRHHRGGKYPGDVSLYSLAPPKRS